jgi:hypothetical protein
MAAAPDMAIKNKKLISMCETSFILDIKKARTSSYEPVQAL